MKKYVCSTITVLCLLLVAPAAMADTPPDTLLMSGVVHTRPDPEAKGYMGAGTLRLRVDRYGNACLVGSSRIPGCGLLLAEDIPAIAQDINRIIRLVQNASPASSPVFRRHSAYLIPLPPRPGHPQRQTGVALKSLIPAGKREGFVVVTLHDAQIGGGGEYFLRPTEAAQFVRLLGSVAGVSHTIDARLTRYEEAEAAQGRLRPPPQNDPFSGFPFNLIPLVGLFL